MSSPFSHIVFKILVISYFVSTIVSAQGWTDAHATFYGDGSGGETEKGACGYDTKQQGYGLETTALSTALFNNGAKCGSCYEIKCASTKFCKQGAGTIKVTATNFCPPSSGPQAWCNAPLQHFDLTMPMFLKIAEYKAGIVPVQYRRINCQKRGNVKFKIVGNPYFLLVLVHNVGGAGDVTGMKVAGKNGNWVTMSRNWGMNWQVNGGPWPGQALSFQVTISSGKTLQFHNVVPSNWQFTQTFEGHGNF